MSRTCDFRTVSHCNSFPFCLLSSPAYSCPSARSPGIWDQALGYGNPPPLYHHPLFPGAVGGPLTALPTCPSSTGHVSVSVSFNQGFFLAFYPKTTANSGCCAFRLTYFTLRVHLLIWGCSDLYQLTDNHFSLPHFCNPQYWGKNGSGQT